MNNNIPPTPFTKGESIVSEANEILSHPSDKYILTDNGYQVIDKQVKRIVKIAKYNFHWSRKALFNFILKTHESLKPRLKPEEIKYSKTSALYQLMDSKQKSLVIKRLDQIERRNRNYNGTNNYN